MRQNQFDAFGEPFRGDAPGAATPHPVSTWTKRTGVALFWALVGIIVVARAIYFDPDLAGRFGVIEAIGRSMRAILPA